jgi:hypothetical protein
VGCWPLDVESSGLGIASAKTGTMTHTNPTNNGPTTDNAGVTVWANNPWTCSSVRGVCSCDVCGDYRSAQRATHINANLRPIVGNGRRY